MNSVRHFVIVDGLPEDLDQDFEDSSFQFLIVGPLKEDQVVPTLNMYWEDGWSAIPLKVPYETAQ